MAHLKQGSHNSSMSKSTNLPPEVVLCFPHHTDNNHRSNKPNLDHLCTCQSL